VAQQTWINLLNAGSPWQTSNGTALTSSASTATISPQAAGPQDFILPSQYNGTQWYTGMVLRVRARGTVQAGTSTSNMTVFLACGVSGTLGTTLTTSGALTLGTSITTATGWWLEALVRVFGVGSSGTTLSAGGDLHIATVTGANAGTLGTASETMMTMLETTTALNTYTAATALGLRATSSAAFGSITCNQFTVEQLD
jgi:hypothetical protein